MASIFPLYEVIKSKVKNINDPLTESQIKRLIQAIKKTDHEIIFILIRTHQILCDKETLLTLPYSSIETKESIEFDMRKFPVQLQRILYHYVFDHI
jgi:hypothetical protein